MTGSHARQQLEEWLGAIRSQSHVLARYPDMLCQQLVNEHAGTSVSVVARERLQQQQRVWVECRARVGAEAETQRVASFQGHESRVLSVVVLPPVNGGERVVSGDLNGEVHVWDPATGLELHRLKAHEGGVGSIVATASGRYVVTGGGDSRIRVWDTESWSELQSISKDWRTLGLCASRIDDRVGIVDGSSLLRVLKVGEEVRAFPTQNWIMIGAVAFMPDDRKAVIGCQGGLVLVLDLESGLPVQNLTGCADDTTAVAVSPDGAWVAAGSAEGQVTVFDAATGKPRPFVKHGGPVTALVFSSNGLLYSASYDETLRVWSVAAGKEVHSVKAHGERVTCLALDKTESLLISGGWDRTLQIWNTSKLTQPKPAAQTGHNDIVAAAHATACGERVVTASWDGTVIEWNATSCSVRQHFGGHNDKVASVVSAADGSRAYSGARDGKVRVFDLRAGKLTKTLDFGSYRGWVNAVALTEDQLLAGTEQGVLRAWQLRNFKPSWDRGAGMEGIRALAVSPDATRIAVGGFGEPTLAPAGFQQRPGLIGIQSLTTNTAQPVHAEHVETVSGLAFEPRGEWFVSVGWDGVVVRHDGASGEALERRQLTHNPLYVGVVSPDGKWIAAGGFDKTLQLLNVGDGAVGARFFCRGEVRACCLWVRDAALEGVVGDSTGSVYFLRVHGIAVEPLATPLPVTSAATAKPKSWWRF